MAYFEGFANTAIELLEKACNFETENDEIIFDECINDIKGGYLNGKKIHGCVMQYCLDVIGGVRREEARKRRELERELERARLNAIKGAVGEDEVEEL